MTLTRAQIEENLNRAPNREERKVLLVTDEDDNDSKGKAIYKIKLAHICTGGAGDSFQLFTTLRQNPASSHLPIAVLDKVNVHMSKPQFAVAARRITEMKAMPEGHEPPPYFALVNVEQRVAHMMMMGWN